MELVQR
jgi:Ca2+-binding EF-hand superfamily protein